METTARPPAEFVSVPEAARRLGIHPKTAYLWTRDGRLPVTRFGRTLRVAVADLQPNANSGVPATIVARPYDVPLPIQLANGDYIESARRDYEEGNSL